MVERLALKALVFRGEPANALRAMRSHPKSDYYAVLNNMEACNAAFRAGSPYLYRDRSIPRSLLREGGIVLPGVSW